MAVRLPDAGSQIEVLNVPALKSFRSMPEPATNRTLPVRNKVACTARTSDGVLVTAHNPSVAAPAGAPDPATRRLAVIADASPATIPARWRHPDRFLTRA